MAVDAGIYCNVCIGGGEGDAVQKRTLVKYLTEGIPSRRR